MLEYEKRTATKNNKKYVLCCRLSELDLELDYQN